MLFTSYLAVTGVAMLVTGAVSSRLGPKWTLLGGLALIIGFRAAAGTSGTIDGIIGFRAGWGLGNALFIATALAVIVGVASGGAIAPWLAGNLAVWYAPQAPFYVGAAAVVVSIAVLFSGRAALVGIDMAAAHAPAAERANREVAGAGAFEEP